MTRKQTDDSLLSISTLKNLGWSLLDFTSVLLYQILVIVVIIIIVITIIIIIYFILTRKRVF